MKNGTVYRVGVLILCIGVIVECIIGVMNDFIFDAAIIFSVTWVAIGVLLIAAELDDLKYRK